MLCVFYGLQFNKEVYKSSVTVYCSSGGVCHNCHCMPHHICIRDGGSSDQEGCTARSIQRVVHNCFRDSPFWMAGLQVLYHIEHAAVLTPI